MFMFQLVQQPEIGMIDYFETKSQPITMAMVLKSNGIFRAKKGGAGVDGMTWAELDANLQEHLFRLWNRLSLGSFFPEPFRQMMREISDRHMLMPGTFVSSTSKTTIKRKFRELEIHKRRKPIAYLARELNPVIEGIIQYNHKFLNAGKRPFCNQLNHRLLKWVKWEKCLFKYLSLSW